MRGGARLLCTQLRDRLQTAMRNAKRSPKTSSASRPLRGEVRRGYRAQKLTTVCHPQMFDLLSLAGYGHQRGHTYLREAQDCGPFGGSCGHASLRAAGPEPF